MIRLNDQWLPSAIGKFNDQCYLISVTEAKICSETWFNNTTNVVIFDFVMNGVNDKLSSKKFINRFNAVVYVQLLVNMIHMFAYRFLADK